MPGYEYFAYCIPLCSEWGFGFHQDNFPLQLTIHNFVIVHNILQYLLYNFTNTQCIKKSILYIQESAG